MMRHASRSLRAGVLTGIWAALAFAVSAGEPANPIPKIHTKKRSAKKYFRIVSEAEAEKLTRIPTRPWPDPISGKMVEIPQVEAPLTDCDSDLCPHPVGRVRFYSPIALSPYSGFAAYRQDFMKPQPPQVVEWVRENLQPRMREALRILMDLNLPITDEEIAEFFEQEDLPDTIRCEHALAYYNYIKAPSAVRARLAWLCAWAHRRVLVGPIQGPYVMDSVRRVLEAYKRERADLETPIEDRINLYARFFEQTDRFSYMDRQVVRLFLAGCYDRLGMASWARTCLLQVLQAAEKTPSDGLDPWMEGTSGTAAEKAREAEVRRTVIALAARQRLKSLQKEAEHLALAVFLIQEALAANAYPPEKIPTFLYLVGEFERRQEHFARARRWLVMARRYAERPDAGAERMADEQLALLAEYTAQLGKRPPAGYPQESADTALLARLVQTVERADVNAMAPATPADKNEP